MPDDLNVHPAEVLHSRYNEVRVLAKDVVEEVRDFAGSSKAHVASLVGRIPILPRELGVIYLTVGEVYVEGLLATLAIWLVVV